MKVKLPLMTKTEIKDLIADQVLCRIAFRGREYPYIAPFQYTVMKDTLYFHLTGYGRKIRLLNRDPRVCVEIESYTPDLRRYRFVVLRGQLTTVTDPEERAAAIRQLVETGRQRISANFLAAHGVKPTMGWAALTPETAQVIMKLEKITEELGITSP